MEITDCTTDEVWSLAYIGNVANVLLRNQDAFGDHGHYRLHNGRTLESCQHLKCNG